MMKISIAFLAAMSLAALGCHKDKDGDAIAKLTELKGKMCACKDKTCSDKVSAELAEWSQEHERSAGKPASPGEHDTEKVEAVKEEIARCLLKLEFPSGGGAAGAAGGTMGSGSPAAGSADGSAATPGSTDGAAAGSAAAPAPAGAGSAH